jgi:hypothetical protein
MARSPQSGSAILCPPGAAGKHQNLQIAGARADFLWIGDGLLDGGIAATY